MKAKGLLSPKLKEAIQKGSFIKHCPCSPGTVTCGYFNLNLQTGCLFDCSYCILQAYLEDKTQAVFYTNWTDLEDELQKFLSVNKEVRIGTGELSDSLAYESIYPTAKRILELFRHFPDTVFEFKTKAAHVRALLAVKEIPKNIVVSWSLNPTPIIKNEELLTPTLSKRLLAMEAIQKKGYKVGIHFDPLILFPNWQKHYRELISRLTAVIRPERIAWWSLGALRFPPALKKHIFRHPDSQLFWGELIQGQDGKYRYFKPLRLELFRFIKDEIKKQVTKEIPLYLCMEDTDTWQEIFPKIPAREETINRYLYESAMRQVKK
ncbi:MAG: spore photoproduct lyase family protein [Chrysiogenales bacterium]